MTDPSKTPTAPTPAPAPQKPRRALRWLLIASLGLNLLIMGAVVGAIVSGGPKRGGPPGERMISAPYVDAFDREDKRAMRQVMRAQLPPRREMIAQNMADYRAFLAELRADSFDQTAALAIMERQLARASETVKLGRALSIERLGAMSAEDRRAYADRLEERIARIGKRTKRLKDEKRP